MAAGKPGNQTRLMNCDWQLSNVVGKARQARHGRRLDWRWLAAALSSLAGRLVPSWLRDPPQTLEIEGQRS